MVQNKYLQMLIYVIMNTVLQTIILLLFAYKKYMMEGLKSLSFKKNKYNNNFFLFIFQRILVQQYI